MIISHCFIPKRQGNGRLYSESITRFEQIPSYKRPYKFLSIIFSVTPSSFTLAAAALDDSINYMLKNGVSLNIHETHVVQGTFILQDFTLFWKIQSQRNSEGPLFDTNSSHTCLQNHYGVMRLDTVLVGNQFMSIIWCKTWYPVLHDAMLPQHWFSQSSHLLPF